MHRLVALVSVSVAAVLLVAAGGGAASAQSTKLHAKVGPGFTIGLTDESGARVSTLEPGTYEIEVEDESEEHNFHLTGPGVDRMTSVAGMGKETWTVTFTEGTYRYVCDPHSVQMRGRFTVGTPSAPPAPPPPSAVISSKTKLVLTSGPGFVITLKAASGKAVKLLERGTYTVVVRDRSPVHDAHIVAPGFDRRTKPLSYVGTQRWRMKLAKTGTLRFLCDPHARGGMKGSAKIVR
jgi:plastocyanin